MVRGRAAPRSKKGSNKSQSKSKSKSRSWISNALEIAERELGGASDSDDEVKSGTSGARDGRRRGRGNRSDDDTVVNLLKRVRQGRSNKYGNGDDDDSGSGSDSSDSFVDEELDSDEAYGSDAYDDVLNSKFSQTIRDRQKKRRSKGELDGTSSDDDRSPEENDEDDENYTSIDEDELMPLSAVWDMDTKDQEEKGNESGSESEVGRFQLRLDDNLPSSEDLTSEEEAEGEKTKGSGSESESEYESESEEDNPFDEISEDDDQVELKTVTSGLLKDSTKQHSSKRLTNYGTGEENEFMLPTTVSTDGNEPAKLSLEDMLNVVEDKSVVAKADLLTSGKSLKVDIPLPLRIQERNERQAAYEISKKEVDKWNDTVLQNRRAEHLSFPMKAPVSSSFNESSVFVKPSNESIQTNLQQQVDKLLTESNLVDPAKVDTFEQLTEAKMTPQEMKKRTIELRLMRELMFREERKARRLKKIKSKTYHRIKKKEQQRNRELAGLDGDQNIDDEERDIARARERMTLKHSTNSKWARDMIKHGMTNDAQTRDEMEEMLRQKEKLKAKMMDKGSSDESDEAEGLSDIEKSASETELEERRAKLGKSGVLNMAFMKNAEAREREANREEIARLRAFENGEEPDMLRGNASDEENNDATVRLNKGRRVYTPSNLQFKDELKDVTKKAIEEQEIDESTTLVKRLGRKNGKVSAMAESEETSTNSKDFDDKQDETVAEAENPWLVESDDDDVNAGKDVQPLKRSSKVSIVGKDSSEDAKAALKIAKDAKKHKKKSKKSNGNKGSAETNDEVLLASDSTSKLRVADPYLDSADENSDTGHDFMFKQQDVIAEAFADDDVVAEFNEEKRQVEMDEDDKEEDVTLPGWGGGWAGVGTNPNKKRKVIKKIKGVVKKENRRDKNLKNVIINERMNKRSVKYQASAVPFPYESKEQYERSLRMPIGQEWTTSHTYRQMIKPRIMTKPGEVIDPIKAPFK